MKGGHNRLPDGVKKARGTLQKCRTNSRAPAQVLVSVPPAPEGLDEWELVMWNELKPQVDSLRIYTRSSETAFRSLVAAAAMTRHRADYSFREFLDALRITSSLLSRFGLDPASRSKVSVVETGKDEAADFMFDGAPQLTAVAGGKK